MMTYDQVEMELSDVEHKIRLIEINKLKMHPNAQYNLKILRKDLREMRGKLHKQKRIQAGYDKDTLCSVN